MSTSIGRSEEEPIDAVYTWVDGASDTFATELRRTLAKDSSQADGSSIMPARFRDSGELRASLHLLCRYAPWIRRVFLVTACAPPPWLATIGFDVRVVGHDELFAERGQLPTFNSHAIELQLHRIEGLSRRFLYLNDDVFLGREFRRSDVLASDGGQRIYLQRTPLHADPSNGPVHDRAYAHTQSLLTWLEHPSPERWLPAHGPLLLDRDILIDLEQRLPDAFALTSQSRFRAPNDLVLRIMYLLHLLEDPTEKGQHQPVILDDQGPEYVLVRLDQGKRHIRRMLSQIQTRPPAFYCINDDLKGNANPLLDDVRSFLHRVTTQSSLASPQDAAKYWSARLRDNWGPHGVGSLAYGREFNQWRDRARLHGFRRTLGRHIADLSAATVLDAGVGTGLFLREWSALGALAVVGTDFAQESINRLEVELPEADLHLLDLQHLPGALSVASFDAISAMDVLIHIVDDDGYRDALRGLASLLRPGGVLLLSENCLKAGERRHEHYWRSRTRSRIEAELHDAGLQVVSMEPLLTLLNSPVDLPIDWPAVVWDRTMRLGGRSEYLGWIFGALLYPLDRLLSRVLPSGPSTKLLVCRKVESRHDSG